MDMRRTRRLGQHLLVWRRHFGVDLGRSVASQGSHSRAENLAVREVKRAVGIVFRLAGQTVVHRKEVVRCGLSC